MKWSTVGKAITLVATLAVVLTAPAIAATAGGGVRGANQATIDNRRLGRTPIRSTDLLVKGYRGLQSKGLCAGRNVWALFPSYDSIKLPKGITNGREECKRVCDAVRCPAFNYAPAGWYRPGNFWWYPLRYRATDECIIYHDYSMQLPGSHSHYRGSSKAFDFMPTTTRWFYWDWNWANGECFVSGWRDKLNVHGGKHRRLAFVQKGPGRFAEKNRGRNNDKWGFVLGKDTANLQDGYERTLLKVRQRWNRFFRRRQLFGGGEDHPDWIARQQALLMNRFRTVGQSVHNGESESETSDALANAGEEESKGGEEESKTGGIPMPQSFQEWMVAMNLPNGHLITTHDISEYCWYANGILHPHMSPHEAACYMSDMHPENDPNYALVNTQFWYPGYYPADIQYVHYPDLNPQDPQGTLAVALTATGAVHTVSSNPQDPDSGDLPPPIAVGLGGAGGAGGPMAFVWGDASYP